MRWFFSSFDKKLGQQYAEMEARAHMLDKSVVFLSEQPDAARAIDPDYEKDVNVMVQEMKIDAIEYRAESAKIFKELNITEESQQAKLNKLVSKAIDEYKHEFSEKTKGLLAFCAGRQARAQGAKLSRLADGADRKSVVPMEVVERDYEESCKLLGRAKIQGIAAELDVDSIVQESRKCVLIDMVSHIDFVRLQLQENRADGKRMEVFERKASVSKAVARGMAEHSNIDFEDVIRLANEHFEKSRDGVVKAVRQKRRNYEENSLNP